MSDYHRPVMLDECIEYLEINPTGTYIDATFGGGSHARAIWSHLTDEGRLIAFDQDEDAQANTWEASNLLFIPQNFRYIENYLEAHDVEGVDGILADLGVSSFQFDTPERGFSYRFDQPLDMRMSQWNTITAADLLRTMPVADLQTVFSQFGEVRNARTLAQAIDSQRVVKPIETTGEFIALLGPLIRGDRHRYLAQVFQALRIAVNDEVEALKDFLRGSLEVLKPGGRIVVLSYHSLEDRIVKQFFKTGDPNGVLNKDFYGNIERPFNIITKKPLLPSESEQKENPRSRSAKLRVAQKK